MAPRRLHGPQQASCATPYVPGASSCADIAPRWRTCRRVRGACVAAGVQCQQGHHLVGQTEYTNSAAIRFFLIKKSSGRNGHVFCRGCGGRRQRHPAGRERGRIKTTADQFPLAADAATARATATPTPSSRRTASRPSHSSILVRLPHDHTHPTSLLSSTSKERLTQAPVYLRGRVRQMGR